MRAKLSVFRCRYVTSESAQILAIAANISIWRSIRKLRIDHYVLGHFNGLGTIHDELTHFKVEHGMVKSMKEVLLDMVAQKRPAPEARKGVEDWRQAALKSFADNRMIQKPWTRLQFLSLAHNLISEFNPACLEFLPVLETLELESNKIVTLDTWCRKVRCVVQNISRSAFSDVGYTGTDHAQTTSPELEP